MSWFDDATQQMQTAVPQFMGTMQRIGPQVGAGMTDAFNRLAVAPSASSQPRTVSPDGFFALGDVARDVPIQPPAGMPAPQQGFQGMDYYRNVFNQMFPGESLSSDQLWAMKDELAKYGMEVQTNHSGIHGKVKLPDGNIIDVIGGAGSGRNRRQWLDGPGSGGFQMGTFTGGGRYPLASVMGPGLMQPWTTPFHRRSPEEIAKDPSFQFQLQQGSEALQRSAASKGTLLTGGTLKDLNSFAQGLASTFDDKYYNRDWNEYTGAYGIYNNNQANQYGRLSGLAGMGANTASAYGNAQAGLTQDAGAATAGGQAASGSIWGNTIGSIGNIAGGVANALPWYQQAGGGFSSPIGQNVSPNQMFQGYGPK